MESRRLRPSGSSPSALGGLGVLFPPYARVRRGKKNVCTCANTRAAAAFNGLGRNVWIGHPAPPISSVATFAAAQELPQPASTRPATGAKDRFLHGSLLSEPSGVLSERGSVPGVAKQHARDDRHAISASCRPCCRSRCAWPSPGPSRISAGSRRGRRSRTSLQPSHPRPRRAGQCCARSDHSSAR